MSHAPDGCNVVQLAVGRAATKKVALQALLHALLQRVRQRCSPNVSSMTNNIIRQLQAEFAATATTASTRRALRRMSTSTEVLTGHDDALTLLHQLRHADPVETAALLNALLHHVPTEPLALRILIEAFTPCVAKRLATCRTPETELDDLASELLAALIKGIHRIAAEPPSPFPATLIRRCIDRAVTTHHTQHHDVPEPIETIEDHTPGTILVTTPEGDGLRPTRADRFIATLVSAVQHGTVTPEDAGFVARRIVNGEPAHIEAGRRFYSERALQKRLHRTVALLAHHHENLAA